MNFNQKFDLQKTINDMKDILHYLDCEDSLIEMLETKKKVDSKFNDLIKMQKQFKEMENDNE